ncbi:MAG TPA: hypothetical protein VFA44_06635 [Gaiellaceae bacterium]|nr:hypothetical protein [Gaiellaceae bacterium]
MAQKEEYMTALWITLAMVFVVGVLVWLGYGLFEVSPLARHGDQFRDPRTGRRRWESPHLETRDEFERSHPA